MWNRDAAKAEPLAADGADIAASPADAVAGAAIVFTMLTNGKAVSEVLFERGVADSLAEGRIVVDCSSIAPQIAREHARRLAEKGIRHLDAPVSGGVVGAAAGTLAIMAGGDGAAVESLKEVLRCSVA